MKTKANRSLRNGVQVAVVVVGFMTLLSGARQVWAGTWVPFGGNGTPANFSNDGYTAVGISDGARSGVNFPKVLEPWMRVDHRDDWA